MADDKSELLMFYRREIKFQSDLLSSRLSSLLTSQSFLLIAYVSAMSGLVGSWKDPYTLLFPPVLAVLGLVLSFQAWPGSARGMRSSQCGTRRSASC
jgi:hypothetical protein